MRIITKAGMKELAERRHYGGQSKTIKKEAKHTRAKKFNKIVFEYVEETNQQDQVKNLQIRLTQGFSNILSL